MSACTYCISNAVPRRASVQVRPVSRMLGISTEAPYPTNQPCDGPPTVAGHGRQSLRLGEASLSSLPYPSFFLPFLSLTRIPRFKSPTPASGGPDFFGSAERRSEGSSPPPLPVMGEARRVWGANPCPTVSRNFRSAAWGATPLHRPSQAIPRGGHLVPPGAGLLRARRGARQRSRLWETATRRIDRAACLETFVEFAYFMHVRCTGPPLEGCEPSQGVLDRPRAPCAGPVRFRGRAGFALASALSAVCDG